MSVRVVLWVPVRSASSPAMCWPNVIAAAAFRSSRKYVRCGSPSTVAIAGTGTSKRPFITPWLGRSMFHASF